MHGLGHLSDLHLLLNLVVDLIQLIRPDYHFLLECIKFSIFSCKVIGEHFQLFQILLLLVDELSDNML